MLYGYADGDLGKEELDAILEETEELGWLFLTDADARPAGSASPIAHLWDNGKNPVTELHRVMDVRSYGLEHFGESQIAPGMPLAELEEVLVPLYFSHRYQVEAAVKLVGGFTYRHAVRNGEDYENVPVAAADQRAALEALLRVMDPSSLMIPEPIIRLIPPRPSRYGRPRETMPQRTQFGLDPISAAEALADETLSLLLNPARLSRMVMFQALGEDPLTLRELLDAVWESSWKAHPTDGYEAELVRTVQLRVWMHLLAAAGSNDSHPQVRAMVHAFLEEKEKEMSKDPWFATNESWWAQRSYALFLWKQYQADPASFKPEPAPALPDGSPIGMEHGCGWE